MPYLDHHPESNYERAKAAQHDIPRASLYATLALVDAVERLNADVIALRDQLADDMRLLRGEPVRRR